MGVRRGLVAVLVGMALVFFFPRREQEVALHAEFAGEDAPAS